MSSRFQSLRFRFSSFSPSNTVSFDLICLRLGLLFVHTVCATFHRRGDVDAVHDLMDDIQEQQDIANEISDAISSPVGFGNELDEVCSYCFHLFCFGVWCVASRTFKFMRPKPVPVFLMFLRLCSR